MIKVIIEPGGTVKIQDEEEYEIIDAIRNEDFGWEVSMEVGDIINEILTPYFDRCEIWKWNVKNWEYRCVLR